MNELLRSLNVEQRDAVTTIHGPLLVLAGAGTGKTRVITARIAHMLASGIAPSEVLAMTFTNKAAQEMRERVAGLVGKRRAEALTVGTFHSFCVGVLREHGRAIGLPKRFTICDSGDQIAAWRAALRELCIAEAVIQPRVVQSIVSLAKNRMLTPEAWLASAADDRDELIGRAWLRYQAALERQRMVDFDDMLLKTLALVATASAAREALRARYRYCLVDEYQDTNRPQYEILRALCDEHRNLCAVGDDDQSIYGWRGADVRLILDFERHFPGAKVVRLGLNYRSTPQILELATRVIRNNPKRHDKGLRSALDQGPPVSATALEDEMKEAEWVVERIADPVRRREARFRDFAVLVRTGVQPRVFEEVLRARAIPYVLIGGMSFFDRKEVRDVLAYLKLCANPDDEVSLLRIVNTPPRGVGKQTIDKVVAFATAHGISACEAFDRASEIDGVGQAAVAAVQRLRERMPALAAGLEGRELVAGLKRLVEEVSYKQELERLYPDPRTRQLRWAAVLELFNIAENFVAGCKRSKPTLAKLLDRLTLSTHDERDTDGGKDAVTLMTLHAAKGLEFPRVFLVGFEEGLLPHARAVQEDTVEEERRLTYVGITRAQFQLTITWAGSRARAGTRTATFPSRFYYELKGSAPPPDWRPSGAEPEIPPLPTGRGKGRAGAKGRQPAKGRSAKSGKRRSASGGTRARGAETG